MLQTEIPGIGLRINGMYKMVPSNDTYQGAVVYVDKPVKVEIIKIGNIISGEFQPKLAADFFWQGSNGNYSVKKVTMGTGNKVFYPLCTLDKTSIDVPLDSHDKSEFKGIGTATNFVNFSIPFTCQKDARISITLENTGSDSNSLGLVPLDNPTDQNTAKGINVQIYNADTNVLRN
ncbi:hypothetical protein V5094_00010 [Moellerella wisconsensis]|uniref:fimbrial protein n=1 Tax=Moellerella wisconsensis TaxID=158849 RepID=UPI003076572C